MYQLQLHSDRQVQQIQLLCSRLDIAHDDTEPSPVMDHIRVSTPVASEIACSSTELAANSISQTDQQSLALPLSFDELQDYHPVASVDQAPPAGRSFIFINDLPYFYLSRILESIGKTPNFLYDVYIKMPPYPLCPTTAPII